MPPKKIWDKYGSKLGASKKFKHKYGSKLGAILEQLSLLQSAEFYYCLTVRSCGVRKFSTVRLVQSCGVRNCTTVVRNCGGRKFSTV